jgi:hypothetical protein
MACRDAVNVLSECEIKSSDPVTSVMRRDSETDLLPPDVNIGMVPHLAGFSRNVHREMKAFMVSQRKCLSNLIAVADPPGEPG